MLDERPEPGPAGSKEEVTPEMKCNGQVKRVNERDDIKQPGFPGFEIGINSGDQSDIRLKKNPCRGDRCDGGELAELFLWLQQSDDHSDREPHQADEQQNDRGGQVIPVWLQVCLELIIEGASTASNTNRVEASGCQPLKLEAEGGSRPRS